MNQNSKGFNYKYNKSEQLENSISRQWIEAQGNVQNAIRFLIEKYAYENGIYDISKVIPAVRDEAYFKNVSTNTMKPVIKSSKVVEHSHDNLAAPREEYPEEMKPSVCLPTRAAIETISITTLDTTSSVNKCTIEDQEVWDADSIPDCYK